MSTILLKVQISAEEVAWLADKLGVGERSALVKARACLQSEVDTIRAEHAFTVEDVFGKPCLFLAYYGSRGDRWQSCDQTYQERT